MCRPLREQARSHSGSAAGFDFPATQIFSVGAKLARDSGGSGCKDVGCVGLFASKLAHSESAAGFDFPATQIFSVGAKLARDSGGSGCKDVGCVGLFASKLAPTGDLRQASISRLPKSSLWEQSLLAIVVGRLASMLDVPPSSRASFAPTGFALADNWRYVEIRE